MNKKNLAGKSVLMIIAKFEFRDEEFEKPFNILREAGATVTIASSSEGPCKSMLGEADAEAEKSIENIRALEYEAVVFVGGSGAASFFDDPEALRIATSALNSGSITAAICIAPLILANTGLLKGRKVTCFPSVKRQVEQKGAICTGRDIEIDGRLVTGKGPGAAEMFGKKISEAMEQDCRPARA